MNKTQGESKPFLNVPIFMKLNFTGWIMSGWQNLFLQVPNNYAFKKYVSINLILNFYYIFFKSVKIVLFKCFLCVWERYIIMRIC